MLRVEMNVKIKKPLSQLRSLPKSLINSWSKLYSHDRRGHLYFLASIWIVYSLWLAGGLLLYRFWRGPLWVQYLITIPFILTAPSLSDLFMSYSDYMKHSKGSTYEKQQTEGFTKAEISASGKLDLNPGKPIITLKAYFIAIFLLGIIVGLFVIDYSR